MGLFTKDPYTAGGHRGSSYGRVTPGADTAAGRISISLSGTTAEYIRKLADDYQLSVAEVVRRAVSLLRFAIQQDSSGGQLLLEDRNGSLRQVVLTDFLASNSSHPTPPPPDAAPEADLSVDVKALKSELNHLRQQINDMVILLAARTSSEQEAETKADHEPTSSEQEAKTKADREALSWLTADTVEPAPWEQTNWKDLLGDPPEPTSGAAEAGSKSKLFEEDARRERFPRRRFPPDPPEQRESTSQLGADTTPLTETPSEQGPELKAELDEESRQQSLREQHDNARKLGIRRRRSVLPKSTIQPAPEDSRLAEDEPEPEAEASPEPEAET